MTLEPTSLEERPGPYAWFVTYEVDYEGSSTPDKVYLSLTELVSDYPMFDNPAFLKYAVSQEFDSWPELIAPYEWSVVHRAKLIGIMNV